MQGKTWFENLLRSLIPASRDTCGSRNLRAFQTLLWFFRNTETFPTVIQGAALSGTQILNRAIYSFIYLFIFITM